MSTIDPDIQRAETLDCAVAALKLELKYALNDVPTDREWRDWATALKGDRQKIAEIISKRNPWVLTFAEKVPDFWIFLDRRLVG